MTLKPLALSVMVSGSVLFAFVEPPPSTAPVVITERPLPAWTGPQPLVGKMDVVQALAAAKGFRDFADTKNIVIRRGSQILTFNYNDAVKGKAAPIYLQPGDTIVVK